LSEFFHNRRDKTAMLITDDRESSSFVFCPLSALRNSLSEAGSSVLPKPDGVVLLVTMVVLVVLAALGYSLAIRVAAQRHRDNYLIDYTSACYARDSAVKYAVTVLQKNLGGIQTISRPNEPDFSDLFALKEPEYRRLLEQWAKDLAKQLASAADARDQSGLEQSGFTEPGKDANTGRLLDTNEINEVNEPNAEPNAFENLTIPGPYGPAWPFVAEPTEFEIGSTKVKIEIEDENAKYPLGWAVLGDEKVKREAQAGLATFCEWMGLGSDQMDSLREQLKQIGAIRSFQVDFQAATQRTAVTPTAVGRRGTRPQRPTYKTTSISPTEQLAAQTRDFSKLFHSSIIDTDMLAAPTIVGVHRKESALKYMSLWGTTQVNINSAPRQVLEAAFTFGGDAPRIASEIIIKRKEKPFTDIEDLKKQLFQFSVGIDKSRPYITAVSSVFSIRVTAVRGVAKASAVIVVLKEGDKIRQIAVVCG